MTCSLKGCTLDAAFDITAGDDWFTNKAGAHACAFHRIAVQQILSHRYPVVQWHDHEEAVA